MKAPDRGPIRLLPHDPAWPARFRELKPLLERALEPWQPRIEHIGSTAVPGLSAKPVVDILAGVTPFGGVEQYRDALRGAGFEHGPWGGDDDRLFFHTPAFDAHLHVVEAGGDCERRHLRFRDILRADGDVRARYETLKRDLAAQYGHDRTAYADAKSGFVEKALQ